MGGLSKLWWFCIGILVGSFFVLALFDIMDEFPSNVADQWRAEAVDQGHAEYYLDNEHERAWRWLPTEKKETEE